MFIRLLILFCSFFMQAAQEFNLVNRLCIGFDNKTSITLQKIKDLAISQNISHVKAQELLLKQHILFSYAKKELLLDEERVKKQAIEHVQRIMTQNKLSQKQFEEILQTHHNTNYKAYVQNMSYMILLEQVKSRIISSLVVSEQQKKQALSDYLEKNSQKTEIIFINSKDKNLLENIRKELSKNTYKYVKNKYKKYVNVTFSYPILYTEGSLLPVYENALSKSPNSLIFGLFLEKDNSNTLIFKNITKTLKIEMTKDLQDSIVNALKEKLAQNKIEDIVNNELSNSQLIGNCNL